MPSCCSEATDADMESMSKGADIDLDLAKQNIEEVEEKEVPKSEASPAQEPGSVQSKKSAEVRCYANMAFCVYIRVKGLSKKQSERFLLSTFLKLGNGRRK